MKKLLNTILNERTETILYRQIRKQLMDCAQNRKREYRIISIDEPTILMLQNQGIKVEKITEFNTEKYLLSW